MAVDSVERNAQLAENQGTREAYDEREKQLTQKHRREVAELRAHHQEAVAKVENSYKNQLEGTRESSRSTLSAKEKQHLKEIQDVQSVSRRRLEKVKEDDDDKFTTTRSTLEGEVARAKQKDDQDTKRLTKNFESSTQAQDSESKETEEKYRENSQSGLKDQAKRLQSKFNDERGYYQNYIREKNTENGLELKAQNQNRETEVSDLKRGAQSEKGRLGKKYEDAVHYERDQYNKSLASIEDSFQRGLKENKQKFHNRGEQLSDQFHQNFENLKKTTADRVDNEVDSAKHENVFLKNQNEIDKHEHKQSTQREKQDLTEEFQKNYEELETRRVGAVKDANVDKQRHIERLQRDMTKNYSRLKTQYDEKLVEHEARTAHQFDGEVLEVHRQKDLEKIQGEHQRKKLYEVFADSTVAQTNFYEEQMDMRKKDFGRQLTDERLGSDKIRTDDVSRLQEQMSKESVNHQEKLVDTIGNYEKQLSSVRGEYEKKLRRQGDLFREQTNKQVKGMQMDREASEMKLQQRMNQMKENYEKELDQLRKRQLTERQDLALKKT